VYVAFVVAWGGACANSPFTTALLCPVETSGLEIHRLMAEVRRDVREAALGQQVA